MGKNLMKRHQRRAAKQDAHDKAKDLALTTWSGFSRRHDVVMLYTLLVDEGYGRIRGPRFYLRMIENQVKMIEQFRSSADDDETHYLVMEKRLKDAGIDVDDLIAKADAIRMPVCNFEERQKMIKEYNNA